MAVNLLAAEQDVNQLLHEAVAQDGQMFRVSYIERHGEGRLVSIGNADATVEIPYDAVPGVARALERFVEGEAIRGLENVAFTRGLKRSYQGWRQ
jgi:hypothetical protein